MADNGLNLDGWLSRIGYAGPREPTLPVLRAILSAHSAAIPFEDIGPFLGQVPRLDLASLQAKMIAGGRGGYCFEQNTLLRAGLTGLGFKTTSLIARVVIGRPPDAASPATHMTLRVDLPEGPFLADVGFGHQTPTVPLALEPHRTQETPHAPMRLTPFGDELVLEAELAGLWQPLYRFSLRPAPDIDYEVGNWFCATHPQSLFTGNLILARPGRDGLRHTLLNGQVSTRRSGELLERRLLEDARSLGIAVRELFLLTLPDKDVAAIWAKMAERDILGASHPAFA